MSSENQDSMLKDAIDELKASRFTIEQSQQHSLTPQALPMPAFSYAGFWIRVVAAVIDAAILGLALFLVNESYVVRVLDLEVVMSILVTAIYYIGFHVKTGQTLGKRVVRIKVVNSQGALLDITHASIRYIGKVISYYALCLGVLWVAFDKHKQAWHDKMVKSFVIKIS